MHRQLKFGAAFLSSLVISCAHTHTHTGCLQEPWRCLTVIWCIPLPFLIHHFHAFFHKSILPSLGPDGSWMQMLLCSQESPSYGLSTQIESKSPQGFRAAVKHQSATETQPHHHQHHHPTSQINPDTVSKLLRK